MNVEESETPSSEPVVPEPSSAQAPRLSSAGPVPSEPSSAEPALTQPPSAAQASPEQQPGEPSPAVPAQFQPAPPAPAPLLPAQSAFSPSSAEPALAQAAARTSTAHPPEPIPLPPAQSAFSPSTLPQPFADPLDEATFQAVRQVLLNPPPARQKPTLLLYSLAAFVVIWLIQGNGSPADLAILVGVLIVHELGHAIGMRAFGYQDVSVFFIPLFGAAASGRPRGVARSKQAIVLLLGPLPGIIAACAIAWLGGPPWLYTTALMLLFVNALNLIPVEPLDGGQLFQVLLFSRNRHLELVFRGATVAVVVAASLYFKFWVLAIVGYFLLVTLPHRARLLAAAAKLRPLGWPEDPAALDEAQQRTLFRTAWDSLPASWRAKWRSNHRAQAGMMEQILVRATQRPPSALASLGVFALWLAGVVLVVVGATALVRSPLAPAPWERYDNRAAAFSIELPGTPLVDASGDAAGGGPSGIASAVWRSSRYDVVWFEVASSTDWLRNMRTRMAERPDRVPDAALPEDDYMFRDAVGPGNLRVRLIAGNNGFGYLLTATPADDPNWRRVFDSFEARANPRF